MDKTIILKTNVLFTSETLKRIEKDIAEQLKQHKDYIILPSYLDYVNEADCTSEIKIIQEGIKNDKKIKGIIKDIKEKRLIHKIEKALGFKLYEWQKNYILGKSAEMPNGRRTGRTTADMLYQLVGNYMPLGVPLEFHRYSHCGASADDANTQHGRTLEYKNWYINELMKINNKLRRKGIKTREVIII